MNKKPKQEFVEVRCSNDKTLLFRARTDSSGEIEIKCRRCGEKRRIYFPPAGMEDSKTTIEKPNHLSK